MKIDVNKLHFRPVPAGYKMKYAHFYSSADGKNPVVKIAGKWYIVGEYELDTTEYSGVRKLFATDAMLEDSTGRIVHVGTSVCNPKDTPVKKLGRAIAHNRCIKKYELADSGALEAIALTEAPNAA